MSDGPPRSIAFLGFGLIAGSVARALAAGRAGSTLAAGRAAPVPLSGGAAPAAPRLVAWSPSNTGPEAAVSEGVLDATARGPAEALDGADLVVIGAPPIETIQLVTALGGTLRRALAADAVVTDLASTKGRVVEAANAARLRFVGGHPMAGREVTGYGHSLQDLFTGRPWVLVAGDAADEAAVNRVSWLVTACGARPIRMDAATHDAAAAAISHLPLVVAAALAEAVAGGETERPGWIAAGPLAASGWRDMTRLARGDPTMGAGIAATNSAILVDGLRAVRAVLDSWIDALARDGGPDAVAIEARLHAIRDRLEPPGDVA